MAVAGDRVSTAQRGRKRGIPSWMRYPVISTVALAALSPAMPGSARAQPQPAAAGARQSGAVAFRIPAGSLDQALAAFGAQSGLQVIYDSGLTTGQTSPGLSGSLPPDVALQRLLAGTDLLAQTSGARAVILTRPPVVDNGSLRLPELQVSGNLGQSNGLIGNLPGAYAGGQVATGGQLGLLGNRSIMDVPFSQTNYTSRLMQDQQARTVNDVLANDPSARGAWSDMSYTYQPYIRGFLVSPWDVGLNGLFGVVPGLAFSSDSIERVEVLRGPSALLNGMPPFGSVGGTINIVTKRASELPITRLTTTYASRGQFGGQVDVGRRFGANQEWGARFNGSYRNGDVATRRQSQEMGSGALGLDYRGERLRLSLDIGFQRTNVESPLRPTYLTAGIAVPKAPKADANWFQPWTYAHAQDWYGALRAEYDLAANWTAFAAVGGRQNRSYLLSGFATINNGNGNLTEAPFNFPTYHDSDSQEIGLRGRFTTGAVQHQLALTGNRIHDESGSLFPVVAAIASNLYHPTFVPEPSYARLSAPRTTAADLTSLGFADTMSILDERLQLIWGLRQQAITARNYNSATGAVTSRYHASELTPSVGLVIKPWRNVSLYTSYIEGLQQGTTVGVSYANAGQVLPPYVSEQYEAGAKVDWGRFTTTLALFQITQPSGTANPATNIYSADGEQRNRGIELSGFGEVANGVRLLGGVTLLQGRLTHTAGRAFDGNTPPSVPSTQLNIGAEWDTPLVQGLTLSGRAIYTSGQYYDNANAQRIPDWVRFDIGARQTFEVRGRPITIRGSILNVANRNYWAAGNPTWGLSLGVPRTFLLSTSFDF